MALSKDLRDYINRKFDEKIKDIKNDKNEAINKYRVEQQKKIKEEIVREVEPEYSAFVNKLKEVKDEYGESIHYNYYIREIIAVKHEEFVDPRIDTSEIAKKYDDILLELNKQRDTLLIQLSMEKDFERIKEILVENGIGL